MILFKGVRLLIVAGVTVMLLVSLARAENCTQTLGYWRNNPAAWPSMPHTLGTVSYDQGEWLSIVSEPLSGNGLASLAHHLIAAKLNIANGANSHAIDETIEMADRMIGNQVVPPIGDGFLRLADTIVLGAQLNAFNKGDVGPGPCGAVSADERTWGRVKSLYQ
jgi:hypothetical protein